MTTASPPAPNPEPRPTLNVAEAAELLGLSSWLVLQQVAQGNLPHKRFGRRIRIPRQLPGLAGRAEHERAPGVMTVTSELLELAHQRIGACQQIESVPGASEGAARLLADLYATGLRHGIAPDDWAAVTALPGACMDACRAQQRRSAWRWHREPIRSPSGVIHNFGHGRNIRRDGP